MSKNASETSRASDDNVDEENSFSEICDEHVTPHGELNTSSAVNEYVKEEGDSVTNVDLHKIF